MQFSLNGGGLGRNAYIGPKRLIVAYLLDNFSKSDMCICVFVFPFVFGLGRRVYIGPKKRKVACFPDNFFFN